MYVNELLTNRSTWSWQTSDKAANDTLSIVVTVYETRRKILTISSIKQRQ